MVKLTEEQKELLMTHSQTLKVFYKAMMNIEDDKFNYEEFSKIDFEKFKTDLENATGKKFNDVEYKKGIQEILSEAEENKIERKTLDEILKDIMPKLENFKAEKYRSTRIER